MLKYRKAWFPKSVSTSFVAHCRSPSGSFRCNKTSCAVCPFVEDGRNQYTFHSTEQTFKIKSHITCETSDVIYMIQCTKCNLQYIGETKHRLKDRFTALFNNMRTLKFKAQPTNAFFATVNQLFGGSSQLPTMLSKRFDLITARSAVVGSWEEPPNIWLIVARNAFFGWAVNFRVRMLLKSAVMNIGDQL